ncbi:hypothetical protein EDD18DRAFT_1137057 [Armillaria luteobubalina]|uniref:Phosphatidic acid phosphatase type 2/haloperoxidase domain-containing protein n=1 Tax=Armillaria luteobubalina TaxID=153913 RepID=A0AA39QHW9_9AGAR|nr:hypothetical protein EDD18DRAFT_1137057 [Armillaria luteobubalina]
MAEDARVLPRWLKFLDNTNEIVTTLTACSILYTWSPGVIYFASGAVSCSLSVKLIKRAIRQPRPPPTTGARKKVTYGMPSTHSATITFFAEYTSLACAYLPVHPSLPSSWITRILPPIIVLPWAAMIVMSRIWLGHHTLPQVVAGCSYGIIFSYTWYLMWVSGLNECGRWATQTFPFILQ